MWYLRKDTFWHADLAGLFPYLILYQVLIVWHQCVSNKFFCPVRNDKWWEPLECSQRLEVWHLTGHRGVITLYVSWWQVREGDGGRKKAFRERNETKISAAFLSRMKKSVWKDVPNPNKCSWAKGLDLKKVKLNVKTEQFFKCFNCDSFAW